MHHQAEDCRPPPAPHAPLPLFCCAMPTTTSQARSRVRAQCPRLLGRCSCLAVGALLALAVFLPAVNAADAAQCTDPSSSCAAAVTSAESTTTTTTTTMSELNKQVADARGQGKNLAWVFAERPDGEPNERTFRMEEVCSLKGGREGVVFFVVHFISWLNLFFTRCCSARCRAATTC